MVSPAKRVLRKTTRRSQSGRTVVRYKRAKPSAAHCALCGGKLNAVPRARPSEMAKFAKTEKRPERIFGGVLCAGCVKAALKEKVRVSAGALDRKNVDFRRFKYVEKLRKA